MTITVIGEPVSAIVARELARNFYFEKINYLRDVGYENLEIAEVLTFPENTAPLYFAFNFNDFGFIIIAGDNNVFPVLGYSFDAKFTGSDMPPPFVSWMNTYKIQISETWTHKLAASEYISAVWKRYLDFDPDNYKRPEVQKGKAPLLTSNWGQTYYYNLMCPEDPESYGGKTPAGCVAVAMAQVMFYFRYPDHGVGSHGYYSDYGYEFADFANTTYHWDEMVNAIYRQANPDIAQLLYHAGVALEMNYGTYSSGANTWETPFALMNYFGYNNSMSFISKFEIGDSFKDSLMNSLDRNIPLIYRGGGISIAHSFVCDGYQDSCFYHFNWGWEGNYNGYYFIDALNPGGYDLTFNQGAVINIYPEDNYPHYCTGVDTLISTRGTFTDGSGPENYLNNLQCSWLIKPDNPGITNIQLWFPQMETDDNSDIITVFDGPNPQSPVLAVISGSALPPVITSGGNELFIQFITNGSGVADGWAAEYIAYEYPFCQFYTSLTDSVLNYFSDGSGPYNYVNGSDCQWLINPQNYDSISSVELYFHNFNLAEDDTLLIYKGDALTAPLLNTFTGNIIPEPFQITGNRLLLQFKSNEINTSHGWAAGYSSILPVYCSDTVLLTDSAGFFEDGSGNKNYVNKANCYWLIETDNASHITLTFNKFDLEFGYDKVKIFDASEIPLIELVTYSGHEIPPPVTIEGNKMLVQFKTDYSQVYDGWEAEYSTLEPAIYENKTNDYYKIFPNPADDLLSFYINSLNPGVTTIRINNIFGQSTWDRQFLFSSFERTINIDVSGIDPGLYFMLVSFPERSIVEKIIIR